MLERNRFATSVAYLLLGLAAWFVPLSTSAEGLPSAFEQRIEDLLGRLTLAEKVGQLQQLDGDPNTGRSRPEHRELARRGELGSFINVRGARNTNEIQRLAVTESRCGIPILFGFDVVHGYRIIFPIPLGLASSWDSDLVERAVTIAAREASAAGVKWTFAPMLAVARDPRWGRIAESFGEDPFLASALARASVRGFQGSDYSHPERIAACAKHWVAYCAAEGGRDYNTTDISEWTLREVYFRPFRAARDQGVATFMSGLNDLNGVPASANPWILTQVLREEWRFDGFVVSDYQAVPELITHGVAADEDDAVRQAISAGVDMEEKSQLFGSRLPGLVEKGVIPRAVLDEVVRRVLRVKFRAGLFDHPYADETREREQVGREENRNAARAVAGRCLVLLKNDRHVLPLGPDVRRIAVVGPLADAIRAPLGHWAGDGWKEDTITLLKAVQEKVASRSAATVSFARGCEVEGGATEGFDEAVRIAREADVVIAAVGETDEMSGEASSRSMLGLPGHQLGLVRAVQATGTPVVVVLFNGRPLAIPWVAEHVPAILEGWLGGTEGGHALADALFGDLNPGGKLPVTFPRDVGQVPLYYNHANTGRPPTGERYTSKYLDVPIGPLFPFGHGLSYTRFELSDLQLGARTIPVDGHLDLRVKVQNVGDRAGDEVVQLYIRDVVASRARPVKELRGFERVTLAPGETKTISFTLTAEELGFYDRAMRFRVEPGEFRVMVGTSSEGGLEGRFEVVETRGG